MRPLVPPDYSPTQAEQSVREPEKTHSTEVETLTLEVGSYHCALNVHQGAKN